MLRGHENESLERSVSVSGSESETDRERERERLNCLVPTDNEESEGEK